MAQHKLSIVIPAFKDYHKIRHCLLELGKVSRTDFNVIIVDHSERKNISHWVCADFPHVTCLSGSPDLWWSGAINIGIKSALECGSDLIMLLNHDCYVRKDTIRNLLNSIRDAPNEIISPVQFNLLTKNELICATSFFLLGFPTITIRGRWCKSFRMKDLVSTGLIIGGRGAIIHSEIFKSVGYFDEINLPHYWADHDFYLRCKKSGVKLYTCINAIVDVDGNSKLLENKELRSPEAELMHDFVDRRSHRNVKDIYFLFSKYYPIPGLAFFGVLLYVVRYLIVKSIKKMSTCFKR